jgi:hypothetical protein
MERLKRLKMASWLFRRPKTTVVVIGALITIAIEAFEIYCGIEGKKHVDSAGAAITFPLLLWLWIAFPTALISRTFNLGLFEANGSIPLKTHASVLIVNCILFYLLGTMVAILAQDAENRHETEES